MMQLKLYNPSKLIIGVETNKIVAEDNNGSFCLLPKHIDCVRILKPCILTYQEDNNQKYIGIDEGILIKCKKDVYICVKNAISGVELGKMKEVLEDKLKNIIENDKKTRELLNEIEIGFVKKYVETKK